MIPFCLTGNCGKCERCQTGKKIFGPCVFCGKEAWHIEGTRLGHTNKLDSEVVEFWHWDCLVKMLQDAE